MNTRRRQVDTPWGVADYTNVLADGILHVQTPSHGGVHLDEERNGRIPAALRNQSGWYEEDCEVAIVALVYPGVIGVSVDQAHAVVARWWPEEHRRTFPQPPIAGPGDLINPPPPARDSGSPKHLQG